MRINCNPNDVLFTVGSPCDVIFILNTTLGSKHDRSINNCKNIQLLKQQ